MKDLEAEALPGSDGKEKNSSGGAVSGDPKKEAKADADRKAADDEERDSAPETADLQEMSIEDSFEELQKILTRLQDPQIPLEESFREYERGMKLVKHCSSRIREVEQKVQKLSDDGSLTDFEVQ